MARKIKLFNYLFGQLKKSKCTPGEQFEVLTELMEYINKYGRI